MRKLVGFSRIAMMVSLMAALALTMMPGAALAARGGGKPGGSSGTSGSYSVSISPAGPYSFGQLIYITTNVPVELRPFISLECFQNGVKVGGEDHAAFPDGWYYGWPFTLGPTGVWTGGAADCTVTVFHIGGSKRVIDARTSLHVNA